MAPIVAVGIGRSRQGVHTYALAAGFDAGRTVIRGPGVNNWDAALVKSFTLRDPCGCNCAWKYSMRLTMCNSTP